NERTQQGRAHARNERRAFHWGPRPSRYGPNAADGSRAMNGATGADFGSRQENATNQKLALTMCSATISRAPASTAIIEESLIKSTAFSAHGAETSLLSFGRWSAGRARY